jgi:hypothetical protein
MIIEIDTDPATPSAAGVAVHTEAFSAKEQPTHVGTTWIGICTAINDYMRAGGARDFDCLKKHN